MEKTRCSKRALSLLLAALMCLSLVQPALAAGNETARTVQLKKTEGTVTVTNSGGRSLSLRDDMRLYNGYTVETDGASYAWLSLDSSKLSKLDEESEAELRKSGAKLELLVNSGELFFNVTEPLEEEETLNIRTSTMVVGIRGTCGWVKVVDQWHSRLYVLEGRVSCSVTDPVTGQVKTTVLTGGEWAEFVVYDQSRPGDKCDIIRQRYAEDAVPGFVLVELADDPGLCERIYEDSGLDLRDVTPEQARERLEEDQAELAEKVKESERERDEQDRNVSTDPVWEQPAPTPGTRPNNNPTVGTGPTAPVQPPDGITNTTPTTTRALTMTMPVTIPQIQAALDPADVSSVTVLPGTGDVNQLVQQPTETLNVAAGKTLTLADGVDLVENGTLNVDGTMTVNGNLDNYGTIKVTSSNSLHVNGYFHNHTAGAVNNIASGHIVPAQGIENDGAISTSGNAVLESGSGTATVTMADPGATLNLNGGSISNTGSGNALRWTGVDTNMNETVSAAITGTSTTSIWTAGDAPLAVVESDGTVRTDVTPDGYKVVAGSGQTSLRPTGGVEGGILVYKVTFDANGGRWPGNAPVMEVERGTAMGAVSTAPFRTGYEFVEWQDVGGMVYSQGSAITGDITLYAQWREIGGTEPDPGPVEPEMVTVTFVSEGTTVATITLEKGETVPYTPAVSDRAGYMFTGWDGDVNAAIMQNTTFTAVWTAESGAQTVTVTLVFNGALRPVELTIPSGQALNYPPEVPDEISQTQPDGYEVQGWSTKSDFSDRYTDWTAPVTANLTLYAVWGQTIKDCYATNEVNVKALESAFAVYSTVYVYAVEDAPAFRLMEDLTIPSGKTLVLLGAGEAAEDTTAFSDTTMTVLDSGRLTVNGVLEAHKTIEALSENDWNDAVGTITVNGGYLTAASGSTIDGNLIVTGEALDRAYNDAVTVVELMECDVTGTVDLQGPSARVNLNNVKVDAFVQSGGEALMVENVVFTGHAPEVHGGGLTVLASLELAAEDGSSALSGIYMGGSDLTGTSLYIGSGAEVDWIAQNAGSLSIAGGFVEGVTVGMAPTPVALSERSGSSGRYDQWGGTVETLRVVNGAAMLNPGAYVGSVIVGYSGMLNMSGGTISGGIVEGSVRSADSVGVVESRGTVNVSGGTIIGQNVPAIYMDGGTVTVSGDAIIRSDAIGVIACEGGQLKFNGGMILNEMNNYAVVSPVGITPDISIERGVKLLVGTDDEWTSDKTVDFPLTLGGPAIPANSGLNKIEFVNGVLKVYVTTNENGQDIQQILDFDLNLDSADIPNGAILRNVTYLDGNIRANVTIPEERPLVWGELAEQAPTWADPATLGLASYIRLEDRKYWVWYRSELN